MLKPIDRADIRRQVNNGSITSINQMLTQLAVCDTVKQEKAVHALRVQLLTKKEALVRAQAHRQTRRRHRRSVL